jgi:hypothetical protein
MERGCVATLFEFAFVNLYTKTKRMLAKTANKLATGSSIELRWPFTVWMSRMFMVLPTLILTLISLRFITNPTHAIAEKGVVLSEPEAITDTRVTGAISLTLVLVIMSAIFSKTRLRMGHLVVILTMGLALSVRLYGFATDGTTISMGDQSVKTIGEIVFFSLNLAGLIVQTKRLKPKT